MGFGCLAPLPHVVVCLGGDLRASLPPILALPREERDLNYLGCEVGVVDEPSSPYLVFKVLHLGLVLGVGYPGTTLSRFLRW